MNKCPYCGVQLLGNANNCYNCKKELTKTPHGLTNICIGCGQPIDPNAIDTHHFGFFRDAVSNIDHSPQISYDYYYHDKCSRQAEKEIEYIKNPMRRLSDLGIKAAEESREKYAKIESLGYLIFIIVVIYFSVKSCFG